ncbi:hypothetical protein [Paenarthrobacter sp. YIM B13468]|uniref:hypothetical protein n=1 Tax=Paenarthrobacter sp. YIM B13468 TaxID=3366295 RepID=UPI00366D0BD1
MAIVAGQIAPGADSSDFSHALSMTDLAGGPERSMAESARWLCRAGALLSETVSLPT